MHRRSSAAESLAEGCWVQGWAGRSNPLANAVTSHQNSVPRPPANTKRAQANTSTHAISPMILMEATTRRRRSGRRDEPPLSGDGDSGIPGMIP